MVETADIVIIGAGIIGMSAAYQLARRGCRSIIVLEKGAGPAEGSTGASSAVCRYKYSRPETVQLAADGIAAYRHWSDFLQTDKPIAKYHGVGVLWLAAGEAGSLADEAARLSRLGVRTELLDDVGLTHRFPDINPCREPFNPFDSDAHACRDGGQHLLEVDGGYMDPVDALQDLLNAARNLGAHVRFRRQVRAIDSGSAGVTGVQLHDGSHISSRCVINASGPWCNDLLGPIGLANQWPLQPTRIQMVVVDWSSPAATTLPVCADIAGGIYFRTQNRGQQIIVGSVREEDEQEQVSPDAFSTLADDDFIRAKVHALQHRLPSLHLNRSPRSYAGLYTMNRADVHPVVGETPIPGLYIANGCSGHGFKLAPAIGSLLAQQITAERIAFDTHVDPGFLAFDRQPISLTSKSVLA